MNFKIIRKIPQEEKYYSLRWKLQMKPTYRFICCLCILAFFSIIFQAFDKDVTIGYDIGAILIFSVIIYLYNISKSKQSYLSTLQASTNKYDGLKPNIIISVDDLSFNYAFK